MADPPAAPVRGVLLLRTGQACAEHERVVQQQLAQSLAQVLRLPFLGAASMLPNSTSCYLIPDATLIAPQPGIATELDLYGAVVSHPFVAGKAISHPLVDSTATAPQGWSSEFIARAAGAVLPGYSAFDRRDALRAGRLLLPAGPLRAKLVEGRAGRGQCVLHDERQLQAWLDELPDDLLREQGVVLEQNLTQVSTYSVGQLRVGPWCLSYFGQQRLTTANDGATVYGGSDLWLVRGGYSCLGDHFQSPLIRLAIAKTRCYEEAAEVSFKPFIASRRNCDVAIGLAPTVQQVMGVLEQSWRIGGASSAEIQALLAFAADPDLQHLCASSWEVYGENPVVPPQGRVLYQGNDPEVGPITKGVSIRPWQPPVTP
jgi:hypothetical protein